MLHRVVQFIRRSANHRYELTSAGAKHEDFNILQQYLSSLFVEAINSAPSIIVCEDVEILAAGGPDGEDDVRHYLGLY